MISPFQSAFIPGRWIAENTILVREVLDTMRKSKKKKGLVGIKMDMSKAYDKMEWSFIFKVLKNFGMSNKMIDIIRRCVCSASSAILLNGSPPTALKLERGLRQGDPLSPYLFIIASEVLSRLFSREEERGKFHGIRIGRNTPSISHLMFADDTILFCQGSLLEIKVV